MKRNFFTIVGDEDIVMGTLKKPTKRNIKQAISLFHRKKLKKATREERSNSHPEARFYGFEKMLVDTKIIRAYLIGYPQEKGLYDIFLPESLHHIIEEQ